MPVWNPRDDGRKVRDILAERALVPVPLYSSQSVVTLASGRLEGYYFYAASATPVKNLATVVTTAAAATPSIARLAAYAADRETGVLTNLVAATANDPVLFSTTGAVRAAPASGSEVEAGIWTPVHDRYYFIGAFCVSAVAMPSLTGGSNVGSPFLYTLGGGNRSVLAQRAAATADLPVPSVTVNTLLARAAYVVGEY